MNRLQYETSPYLLQHADNPVDWWGWSDEALAKARQEDKPILLSIGYSACHWCHVMAHESFEDPESAAVMNDLFINIKVDREERPDLDKIYQLAHQLLARRSGGWPLTVFLNPHNLTPFFSGTYFPKTPRHNLPGFVSVITQVSAYYHKNKAQVEQQNATMRDALQSIAERGAPSGLLPEEAMFHDARRHLGVEYDAELGGFGEAPKFPHCTQMEFLLRYGHHIEPGDHKAQEMTIHTLQKMAEGGIYDQLAGGFCRYSTDPMWLIPHFEKMLYDNGPLLALCADGWQITSNPLFAQVVEETAQWVMDDMQSPEGGYYAAIDADSEGHEGKFYVWRPEEVRALLTEAEYALAAHHYGLTRPANFEGIWHLYVAEPLAKISERTGISLAQAEQLLASIKSKLKAVRAQRVPPGRDDKVLSAWNGLMIKGMAHAGRIFGRGDWIASADRAFAALRRSAWVGDRLLATYKNGQAKFNGYLDDYAFMLDAAIELLQCRWNSDDLQWATQLADTLLAHFEAPGGGFYFTADDHESLLYRPKNFADEAMASGNGIAAFALQRLGHLVGDLRYTDAAAATLRAAGANLTQHPDAYASLLMTLDETLYPPTLIILRGATQPLAAWQAELQKRYAPNQLCFAIPDDATGLPDMLAARQPQGTTIAYVCRGETCLAPIDSLTQLHAELSV